MRQLDLDITPAQQYLCTPAGQQYRSFIREFHQAEVAFSGGGSGSKDQNHDMLSERVAQLDAANVIGSRCNSGLPNGLHYPVLDIDVPAMLVPSSTPDHSHLYIRKAMPWQQYSTLLGILSWVGIVEDGYVGAGMSRQETFVRTPWTLKG